MQVRVYTLQLDGCTGCQCHDVAWYSHIQMCQMRWFRTGGFLSFLSHAMAQKRQNRIELRTTLLKIKILRYLLLQQCHLNPASVTTIACRVIFNKPNDSMQRDLQQTKCQFCEDF
jgi:hypothetical protein